MKQSLEELLRSMKTMPEVDIDDTFRANARIRILNVASKGVMPQKLHGLQWISYHITRWIGGTFIASFLVGGSFVYAAQYSKPGSALYGVKTASEQAALSLAPTKKMKTSVATTVLDRRAQEVDELKTTGTKQEVNQAIFEYHDTVRKLERTTGVDTSEIEMHVEEHKDALESSDERSDRRGGSTVTPSVSQRTRATVTPATTTSSEDILAPTSTRTYGETKSTSGSVEVKTTVSQVRGDSTEKKSEDSEANTHTSN